MIPENYVDDVDRIVRVLNANGYRVTSRQAFDVWSEVSDERAAGWLGLPESDATLIDFCRHHITEYRSSYLGFDAAMKWLLAGHSLRRAKWKPGSLILKMQMGNMDPFVVVVTQASRGPWIPSQCDVFAKDWELLE